jgi:hypothetical protein
MYKYIIVVLIFLILPWNIWAQTCPELTISNQTFSSDIRIGSCTVTLKNVTIQNNSNLIVNSEMGISINGEFNVNVGSSFKTLGCQTALPTLANTTAVYTPASNSATSVGNITYDGGATVTSRGICWATTQNPTTANSKIVIGSGTGSFTGNLIGLTGGTTYYVRSYAINSAGTAYGTQTSFTTLPSPPIVWSTKSVTGIACGGATSGGDITSDGGAPITARGVCYATTPDPTIVNSKTVDAGTTGIWTSGNMSIVPGSLYYVRSYATNSVGTGYGYPTTYTQSIAIPWLTATTPASSITSYSAISGGYVGDGCGTVLTERGICWATTPNPTTANSTFANGTGTGSFTGNLTGLIAGTTYYVRSYAICSVGTAYGTQTSFTTLPIVANITSSRGTTTSTTASIKWTVTLASSATSAVTIPYSVTNATNTGITSGNFPTIAVGGNTANFVITYNRLVGTTYSASCNFGTMPTGYAVGATSTYSITKQ